MNVYWIRPETALWRTLDCLALHDIQLAQPIVDVGCGDGLFNFTWGGRILSPQYDIFTQGGRLDAFFEKVDIYDYFDEAALASVIEQKPAYQINLGLEHKEANLKRPSHLVVMHKFGFVMQTGNWLLQTGHIVPYFQISCIGWDTTSQL